MVGDDIRGDVQGAQHAGLCAALVRTGKFQPQDLESGVEPEVVLDSVASLPAWWRANAEQ
jgi:ribonucleotide monophosphatase NagD (HAD superfamily)